MLEEEEISANAYNVSACCERVSLAGVCMPLCSYDAKMSDLRTLAPLCAQEFHKLLRCGAGGQILYQGTITLRRHRYSYLQQYYKCKSLKIRVKIDEWMNVRVCS